MSIASGVFKARQFGADSALRKSFVADSTMESTAYHHTAMSSFARSELTKNDKYCVSRLPALPPILSNYHMDDSVGLPNGYADGKTGFALVVNEKAINVWPYNSSDDVPISFEFPLGEGLQDALQLAILTSPSPGTSLDPGLVIINSVSGHVRFYESVQHAPALGMISNKSIETIVNILASLGEYITLAENIEPAGIVVATSWKRVVLILLRDYRGAPKLSTSEITRPATSSRFFSGWLGSHDDELTNDIVSLKAGAISSQGTQEFIVQDAAGTFTKYVYQDSSLGTSVINYKATILYKLATHLESNIDGLIPGSVSDVKFLDLWPVFSKDQAAEKSDFFISLVCVQSSLQSVNEERLALLTMKINESGVMLIGSHQLPEVCTTKNRPLVSKPKLYIPRPGHSAFVIIGNAVVLCDLDSEAPKMSEFSYYKPKWKDTIKFKPNVQVIGLGYEDKVKEDENPALLLITADFGVVRIERFVDACIENESSEEDSTNPVALLKSHIQQAIHFSESPFVDLNVGSEYLQEIIVEAVSAIAKEIMECSSPYFPPYFASTRDSFDLRLKLLRELLTYVRNDFTTCWTSVYPTVVEVLEKVESALNLWNIIDSDEPEAKALKGQAKAIITDTGLASPSPSFDVLRSFFSKDVDSILEVLSYLLDNILNVTLASDIILRVLLATLHDAIYMNELTYIVPVDTIPPRKLWVFDSSLILRAEELIYQTYCTKDRKLLQASRAKEELVKFTAAFYYIISSAIRYLETSHDEQLIQYTKWFDYRSQVWIQTLLENGLLREALVIAEQYKDFSAIARVLEKEREHSSPEYIQDKIAFYMSEYMYEFACKLFQFYVEKEYIQRLLSEFGAYEDLLTRFLEENPLKTGKFSWIHYLRSESYEQASNVLISLAANKNLDNQRNREFCYSMAKLSSIAAEAEDSQMVDKYALQELIVEAENNLVVIRIQNKLYNYISLFVQGQKEMITLNYFLDNFVNPKLSTKHVSAEIESFFRQFVNQETLTEEELVTLLTDINPISQLKTTFADALTVTALITNDNIFRELAGIVWAKLFVKTDDWNTFSTTDDNTDEVNKIKIRETVLYHTLRKVKDNKDILAVLDAVLNSTSVDRPKNNNYLYWLDQVHQLQQKVDVKKWVIITKAEV